MNGRWMTVMSGAALLLVAYPAHGQVSAPGSYFDCPYVNYFDNDCPQLQELWQEQEQRRRQHQEDAAAARGREPETPAKRAKQKDGSSGPDIDETPLLFPKESLAPDAPPLFRRLLAEPTIENARRYVRWYSRRAARLQAVQELIRLAGSELESDHR